MILYDKQKMNDVAVVGGKAVGLAKLIKYGCCVPDFFVITAGTALNDEFAAELETFAANLHCGAFSVRSSSVSEDSAKNSFAGQFLTHLNVQKENLFNAVKDVAQSANRQNAGEYARYFHSCSTQMAIIVQKQITGVHSGVLFTQSPLSSDEILLEYVEGAGETLVSGAATPQKVAINKHGVIADDGYRSELARTAIKLEEYEGHPLDLEWTFADKLYFLQMRPLTALSDPLPVIPDRNWNFYVYRDFCVLAHSVQKRAAESDLQERVFGFSIPIYQGLLVNGREFYSDENDSLTIKQWADLDKDNFFEEYIQAIKKLVKRTKYHANNLKNKSFHGCDIKRLFAVYRKKMNAYIESYAPLMMRPDDYLIWKYQSLNDEMSSDLVNMLTPIWKRCAYSEEKTDILRTKISGNISNYIEKYEWINNPLGKRIFYLTNQDVEKRLQRLTVQQTEEKLKDIELNRAKRKAQFLSYIKGIDNETSRRILRLISQFIYLRTYTAENSDRLFYYIRERLVFEIADRINIPHEEILSMTYVEISKMANGERIDKLTLAKRRSGELITFFGKESRTYYGNNVNAILKKLLPKVDNSEDTILSGDVACAGEVSGSIKIVRDFTEVNKVEEGDIVVTSMTTPEIVAALEKAGGIVTDEGGITCHAAIIAREYGVPCLVGTKCATSVLRDGMRVFLDCFNGRIEIISDKDGE